MYEPIIKTTKASTGTRLSIDPAVCQAVSELAAEFLAQFVLLVVLTLCLVVSGLGALLFVL